MLALLDSLSMKLDARPFLEFLRSQNADSLGVHEKRRYNEFLSRPPAEVEVHIADAWFTKFDRNDLFRLYYGE